MQSIQGKYSGRITSHHSDPLRRWSTQSIRLKNDKILSIISAYRPGSAEVEAGSLTIITQQSLVYKSNNITTHPRKQFLHDLKTYILDLQLSGHEILLGLDANIQLPDPDYLQFITDCKIIDIINNHNEGTQRQLTSEAID